MTPRTLSVLATGTLIIAVVALVWSGALLAHSPVAIAGQAAAALLMLWARLTFGMRSFHAAASPTAGGLVTSGPYRFWRHPIYAAILFFIWIGVVDRLVIGAVTPARLPLTVPAMVTLAALATAATAIRMLMEERLLRAKYPEYSRYAAATRRIIPFVF